MSAPLDDLHARALPMVDLITDGIPDLEAQLHLRFPNPRLSVLYRAIAVAADYWLDQIAAAEHEATAANDRYYAERKAREHWQARAFTAERRLCEVRASQAGDGGLADG